MKLYHGTSKKNLDSIKLNGIKMFPQEVWPDEAVCALDTLDKAKKVAGYFGKDGVVIEIDVPDEAILFHPDYGQSPEFDTIYITIDVPSSMITNIIDAPSNLEDKYTRPPNMQLRQWKSQNQDPSFNKRLNDILGL